MNHYRPFTLLIPAPPKCGLEIASLFWVGFICLKSPIAVKNEGTDSQTDAAWMYKEHEEAREPRAEGLPLPEGSCRLAVQVWGLRRKDSMALLHSMSGSLKMAFGIQKLTRNKNAILKANWFSPLWSKGVRRELVRRVRSSFEPASYYPASPWNSVPDREFSVGMPMILHQCWVTLSSIAIHFLFVDKKILPSLFLCFIAPIPTLEGVLTYFRLDVSSVPWQTEADVSLLVLHLPGEQGWNQSHRLPEES